MTRICYRVWPVEDLALALVRSRSAFRMLVSKDYTMLSTQLFSPLLGHQETLGSMLDHVPCTPWHARVRHTKIFTRCTKDGVPYVAVLITWAIGLLSYLNLSNSGSNVFYWFTNITNVGGFISWVLVGVAYLVSSFSPDHNSRYFS